MTGSFTYTSLVNRSHLVGGVSLEETRVIVDDSSKLGPVQKQNEEKEFLQNVL